MKRVIDYKLGEQGGMYYMPCCNTFCRQKPKVERGHKKFSKDCLLTLLGEEVKSQAIAFKKQQRKLNKTIDRYEFLKLFRQKAMSFFKDKAALEWVGDFIETLPKKDGCFQLPLFKTKAFSRCLGIRHPVDSTDPLRFKVDLVDFELYQTESRTPSPRRDQARFVKSSQKKNKKLKIQFNDRSKKPTENPEKRRFFDLGPKVFHSDSSSKNFEVNSPRDPQQTIGFFQGARLSQSIFELQNQKTAKNVRPVFMKNFDSSSSSFIPADVSSLSRRILDPATQEVDLDSQASSNGDKVKQNLDSRRYTISEKDHLQRPKIVQNKEKYEERKKQGNIAWSNADQIQKNRAFHQMMNNMDRKTRSS